jgi:hypothetical protein
MKRFYVIFFGGLFLMVFTATPLFAERTAKKLVDEQCSKCHSLKKVYRAGKTPAQWKETLDDMIEKGADIRDRDKEDVLKFLNTLNK